MNRRLFAVATLAALAACASLPREAAAPANAGFELLESLSAIHADAQGVSIVVSSRGCATRADFAFYVDRKGAIPTLAFGRKRIDACAGPAEPMAILFSWSELGLAAGEPVFVVNPIAGARPAR